MICRLRRPIFQILWQKYDWVPNLYDSVPNLYDWVPNLYDWVPNLYDSAPNFQGPLLVWDTIRPRTNVDFALASLLCMKTCEPE